MSSSKKKDLKAVFGDVAVKGGKKESEFWVNFCYDFQRFLFVSNLSHTQNFLVSSVQEEQANQQSLLGTPCIEQMIPEKTAITCIINSAIFQVLQTQLL